MNNYVIRAVAADKSLRIFVAVTTALVEEARRIHDTTPVATAALGRTLTAAGMMGLMLKGANDKLSIQIKGDGPIKQILAVTDSMGNIKGYVANPHVDLPLKSNGKLDVGGAVGQSGRIVVIKDFGLKEPYMGQSELVNGEIGEDLTAYFAYSEQQPSAVALGVLVDRDYSVKQAGGFIVQVLPNASEETIVKLEERLNRIPSVTQMMENDGMEGEQILETVVGDFDYEILDKQEVRLVCDCSIERLEQALISIGSKDLESIIQEDGEAELTCHFCNTKYHFDKEHLERLHQEAK
ncbi:MAG: Hsp33 family molecular chaperone HslO [Bacillota bacterium]